MTFHNAIYLWSWSDTHATQQPAAKNSHSRLSTHFAMDFALDVCSVLTLHTGHSSRMLALFESRRCAVCGEGEMADSCCFVWLGRSSSTPKLGSSGVGNHAEVGASYRSILSGGGHAVHYVPASLCFCASIVSSSTNIVYSDCARKTAAGGIGIRSPRSAQEPQPVQAGGSQLTHVSLCR